MNRILLIGLTPFSGGINSFIKNTYQYMDRDQFIYDFLMMEQYRNAGKLTADFDVSGSNFYYLDFTRMELPLQSHAKLREIYSSIPGLCGVHVHDQFRMTYPLVLADQMGLPIKVIHFHSGHPKHEKELPELEPAEKERLNQIKGDCFDRLACSDLAGEEGFRGMSFKVIPNGIDPDKFTFNPFYRKLIRSKMNISEETLVFGFFANIKENKNPFFALDVFREFLKKEPNSKMLFVGMNFVERKLSNYIREHNLEDHVRFLQTDESVDMLYSAVDMLLFTSFKEGIGYVLIEAQASGLPCLISDEITDQVKITDLAHMMPLDASPEIWAKKALQILQGKNKRMSRTQEIIDAGYHAKDVAKTIQSIYRGRL